MARSRCGAQWIIHILIITISSISCFAVLRAESESASAYNCCVNSEHNWWGLFSDSDSTLLQSHSHANILMCAHELYVCILYIFICTDVRVCMCRGNGYANWIRRYSACCSTKYTLYYMYVQRLSLVSRLTVNSSSDASHSKVLKNSLNFAFSMDFLMNWMILRQICFVYWNVMES